MSVCACMGPPGNCPCIRQARGEKIPVTEIFISPDLFDLLPENDKQTINELKMKALALRLFNNHTTED
jgi:hypothetical protein